MVNNIPDVHKRLLSKVQAQNDTTIWSVSKLGNHEIITEQQDWLQEISNIHKPAVQELIKTAHKSFMFSLG